MDSEAVSSNDSGRSEADRSVEPKPIDDGVPAPNLHRALEGNPENEWGAHGDLPRVGRAPSVPVPVEIPEYVPFNPAHDTALNRMKAEFKERRGEKIQQNTPLHDLLELVSIQLFQVESHMKEWTLGLKLAQLKRTSVPTEKLAAQLAKELDYKKLVGRLASDDGLAKQVLKLMDQQDEERRLKNRSSFTDALNNL